MDYRYYIRSDDVLCRVQRDDWSPEILWPDGRWVWLTFDPADVVEVTEDDAMAHAAAAYPDVEVDLRAPNSGVDADQIGGDDGQGQEDGTTEPTQDGG